MSRTVILTCARLLSCACFFSFAPAEDLPPPGADVFDALWQEVETRELWDHPEWWTLGHYHRTLWGRVSSRIDDPRFFLDAKGKNDRRRELAATLRAFLTPEPTDPPPERSLSCRFPARRRWLLETLAIPPETFAVADCNDYLRVREQLALHQATLIYPAGYLNSPASMFGHLLLVLDREGKDRLLSRAVNYAAVVTDSFGPFFAFKGIFGFYDGVYAILPYYDKVEEYSAVNRRDIWEYPLRLDADGLDRLLRHVWELQELKSRYFFFKENCAFNLLYPVEVAHPDLAMTRRFRTNAIPVSLLQELTRSGITDPPIYRPSKTSMLRHWSAQLDPAQQKRALALARGEVLPSDEDPLTLSVAIELTQYYYTEKQITPEVYRERVFPLLRARSRLGKVDLPPPPVPDPPEAGHPPARVQLYAGDDFGGVRLRFAYHAWLDDPRGYPPGSYITFFESDFRAENGGSDWHLREFTFIDVRSLSPPTLWVTPMSWAVNFRAEADPFDPTHHRGMVQFASGRAWDLLQRLSAYAMVDSSLRLDSDLDEHIGWEPGGQWGLLWNGQPFRLGLRGFHAFGVLGSAAKRERYEAEIRVPLREDLDLGLRTQYLREEEQNTVETSLMLSWLW